MLGLCLAWLRFFGLTTKANPWKALQSSSVKVRLHCKLYSRDSIVTEAEPEAEAPVAATGAEPEAEAAVAATSAEPEAEAPVPTSGVAATGAEPAPCTASGAGREIVKG